MLEPTNDAAESYEVALLETLGLPIVAGDQRPLEETTEPAQRAAHEAAELELFLAGEPDEAEQESDWPWEALPAEENPDGWDVEVGGAEGLDAEAETSPADPADDEAGDWVEIDVPAAAGDLHLELTEAEVDDWTAGELEIGELATLTKDQLAHLEAAAADRWEDEAAILLSVVCHLDPENLEARLKLAQLRAWQGEQELAQETFDFLLNQRPEWPEALIALAAIHQGSGDDERAQADARRVLGIIGEEQRELKEAAADLLAANALESAEEPEWPPTELETETPAAS